MLRLNFCLFIFLSQSAFCNNQAFLETFKKIQTDIEKQKIVKKIIFSIDCQRDELLARCGLDISNPDFADLSLIDLILNSGFEVIKKEQEKEQEKVCTKCFFPAIDEVFLTEGEDDVDQDSIDEDELRENLYLDESDKNIISKYINEELIGLFLAQLYSFMIGWDMLDDFKNLKIYILQNSLNWGTIKNAFFNVLDHENYSCSKFTSEKQPKITSFFSKKRKREKSTEGFHILAKRQSIE